MLNQKFFLCEIYVTCQSFGFRKDKIYAKKIKNHHTEQ